MADEQIQQISTVQRMLSACSGSVVTSLLVTPLDVVKTRLQSQPFRGGVPASQFSRYTLPSLGPLASEVGVTTCCREVFWIPNTRDACVMSPGGQAQACAVEETSKRQFRGTWEGLVKIARYEGPKSLWRGLSPTLAMAVPANVIYFTGYDYLRSVVPITNPHIAPLIIGGLARGIAASAISPVELFRTRIQALHTKDNAFLETMAEMRRMLRENGWSSLWRGLRPTLWRDVPFSGVYWLGYEHCRRFLQAASPSKTLSSISTADTFSHAFISGSVSGALASIVTQPFDVAKTRQQVAHNEVSMASVMRTTWQEEGIRGLFRGTVPRVLKVAPACALMISFFELGKKLAATQNAI